MTSGYETLADYCAERDGRNAAPALNVPDFMEAARHLLGYYRKPGGWTPGAFTMSLIRCWELADNINQAKLYSQWPELGEAIVMMKSGRTEGLANVAEGRAP